MRENILGNVNLEHKTTKRLVENKIKEMSKNIKISYDRIKYYTDMLLDQKSEQRVEEFTNMVSYETNRLTDLISDYNSYKKDHAEYFI